MGNFYSFLGPRRNTEIEVKKDIVITIPQGIIPILYENPRQVAYSYLNLKELLKVASLSKRERETVLNSKILKENRNERNL
jgi:hypothetical protein